MVLVLRRFSSVPRFLCLMAVGLALSGCSGFFANKKSLTASGSSSAMIPVAQSLPVHGVDVSRYQGQIDWHEARKAGTRFAYIKATEGGDHADENFSLHWMMAKDAGVPRGVAAMLFNQPDVDVGVLLDARAATIDVRVERA